MFFPPTEQDLSSDDWEEVNGRETAENGEGKDSQTAVKVSAGTRVEENDTIEVETKKPSEVSPQMKESYKDKDAPAMKKVKTSHVL